MTVKISGTDGIDVAQLRAADGDPVALTISAAGVVALPQTPSLQTGPVFRAVGDVGQVIPNGGGYTKLTTGSTTFNPDNAWASNKFQPTKAGYYHIGLWLTMVSQTAGYQFIGAIYKNGVIYDYIRVSNGPSTQLNGYVGSLVYLNGSTDYIEFYAAHNHSSSSTVPSGSPIVSGYFVKG